MPEKNLIKIRRIDRGDFEQSGTVSSSESLDLLLDFLITSVDDLLCLNIAQERLTIEKKGYNAGLCYAEKKDNNIILAHMYVDCPDLIIPYPQFTKLLDMWGEALKNDAAYITIKLDDEYNFEFKYCMLDDTCVRIKS